MLIIAEVGVNHNGSIETAKQMVDVAKECGANIVKFQTFKAESLVTAHAQKATYQAKNMALEGDKAPSDQLSMLKQLELSMDEFIELADYCEQQSIEFLSTAFDPESLEFLLHNTSLKRLKIPSGELTNAPFVLQHARAGLPLIVSTGMATLAEIEQTLKLIAFGLIEDKQSLPTQAILDKCYASDATRQALNESVTLLHCTTEYPAPFETVNLTAMKNMAQTFQLSYGYSDHTEGIAIPIAAAALGASVIEKHFTLSRTMPGPDHKASLEPEELQQMVAAVNQCLSAMGNGVKAPSAVEIENRLAARKSLVAACDIEQGDYFSNENLTCKRPGNGISPVNYWSYLGQQAKRSYRKDELID